MAIVDLDRRVRRLGPKGHWSDPAPLSTYRYAPAYVLLGDPGAGKSTAFDREQTATPRSEPVTARDFRAYGDALPAQTETLFIDGLDEARVGGGDPWGPFDEIRGRLRQLTPKRVRLSCRELDWLGDNDRSNLSKVVPGGEVIVLRLEPLNGDEQRLIIRADPRIADPDDFILQAADRGVESLLTNAQTLVLLLQAVGDDGDFPKGRTETFERACLVLAREPNEDHGNAGPLPPADRLLDAAGRMCTISLLSGSAGLGLPTAPQEDDFVSISVLGDAADAVHAARTRLFVAAGNRHLTPAHANLAAFLAARYLAGLVDGPMPAGRVLALLTGTDGFPPTPLRSLVAWLAVTSRTLRKALIERDPVAVLMYGDVHRFSPADKSLLLAEIGREETQLARSSWPRSALDALATSDMEAPLQTLLRDPDRSDRRQTALVIATDALRKARPMPGLADELLRAAKDETRWPRVRDTAFKAWIRALDGQPDRAARLRATLSEIHSGRWQDPDDSLRGVLLSAMVPGVLSPRELWDFYARKNSTLYGRSALFWTSLPKEVPAADVPVHLDQLVEHFPALSASGGDDVLERVALEMLASGLEHHGAKCEPDRLLRWLQMGAEAFRTRAPTDAAERIRSWLERSPDTVRSLVETAAHHEEIRTDSKPGYAIKRLLFGARLPAGTEALRGGPWLVAQQEYAAKASDEAAESRRIEEGARTFEAQRKREDEVRIESVRRNVEALQANRTPPPLLHELALLYFRGHRVLGPGPEEPSLETVLRGDRELIDAALAGLSGAPERDDLPSAKEILRLKLDGQMHWLTLPVLAGLDLRSSVTKHLVRLTDAQWKTALGCRLVVDATSRDTAWYSELVWRRPGLVAEVLIPFNRALFRRGETALPEFERLFCPPEFAKVAKRVVMPLLRSFPIRARTSQLKALRGLLWSARAEADPAEFRKLIETKLSADSMTKSQRIYWLATGILLDPSEFQPQLEQSIARSEDSIGRLAQFFAPEDGAVTLPRRLHPSPAEFLIRTVGRVFRPEMRDGIERPASMLIRSVVDRLAESPALAAGDVLAKLVADPGLRKWRHYLRAARDTQRVVRRDARFEPPTPAQVIRALADGPPANAADLRELVLGLLKQIAADLRTTNANLWRQFWTEDKERNSPKDENACRDALLHLLQHRLPEGCDAQPEGQYAKNRRADIRVTSGPWNIPVEIKKNSHRDLWRAVRNQLLPRYTTDPATAGLGVYLVLWFGPNLAPLASQGPRPQTADELRGQLLKNPDHEEHRRAAIVVVDVTPP